MKRAGCRPPQVFYHIGSGYAAAKLPLATVAFGSVREKGLAMARHATSTEIGDILCYARGGQPSLKYGSNADDVK
jgi:hypothetical protein